MSVHQKRTIFLHIHIPKCGGTSFNEVLWRNFRLGLQMEYGRFNMLRPTAEEVEWVLWRNGWIQAIAGHRFHTHLNYDTSDHRVVAITFVRDPIQQFTSAYNYMRREKYPGIDQTSIREAADWILGGHEQEDLKRPWFVHGQLRHLDAEADLGHIERLVDAGALLVLPIERFADACLLLGTLYPERIKHVSFRIKNISPRLQQTDGAIEDLVRRHRSHDFRLHEMSNRRLDAALQESMSERELTAARRTQRRECRYLGSPVGEAGYIARRIRDLSRQYLERRRWIRSGSRRGS